MNRLLAISDIHGCYDTFHELLIKNLKFSKSDSLILLGDYIDRGEKSRETVDLIIDLIVKGYQVIPLLGNHEWMLAEAYRNPDMKPLWYMNNGLTTITSFMLEDIRYLDKKYVDFFMNLKTFETVGNHIFVHAGFNENTPDPFSDIMGMIWETRSGYSNPLFTGKTIIHGHRPKTVDFVKGRIASRAAVIPIDTGCVYDKEAGYGFLSALEINSMNLISVERIETT